MDNLIKYTQKINKRQHRIAVSKKHGRKSSSKRFSLLGNIIKAGKNRFKKNIYKNKVSYKPFTMQDSQSKNQSFKNSLKGQYIILPQQIVNHVSNILKNNRKRNVANLAKKSFFKHIKPILVKFSIINIFIIIAGLSVFVSTSIYSSSFVPAGVITLPNDNGIDYLIESFMASGSSSENEPFGDVDLSIIKGFKILEHVVAKGESISVIAKKYNVEQGTIISFNNIKNARMINSGTTIRIPDKNGLFYKVEKGDSLSSIADKYKINLNAILDINNIDSPVITPGQELFIPGAKMDNFALKKALGELFIYPAQGVLTSPYGYRNDPFTGKRMMHYGIDLANAVGTPVRATYDGKVIMCGFSSIYGKYIIIKHQGTYQSLYAHLDKYRVKEGEQVIQNQIIGDMGNTGRSTGPHLHFSIYHNQQPVDPISVLNK